MEGVIESLDLPNNALTVTLDLFGQETSVEAEISQIEKAQSCIFLQDVLLFKRYMFYIQIAQWEAL